MIAQRRFGAVLEFAPGRVITILELHRAALFVSQIPGGKHRTWNLLDQLGSGFRTIEMLAGRNISSTNECESLISVASPNTFWRRFLLFLVTCQTTGKGLSGRRVR